MPALPGGSLGSAEWSGCALKRFLLSRVSPSSACSRGLCGRCALGVQLTSRDAQQESGAKPVKGSSEQRSPGSWKGSGLSPAPSPVPFAPAAARPGLPAASPGSGRPRRGARPGSPGRAAVATWRRPRAQPCGAAVPAAPREPRGGSRSRSRSRAAAAHGRASCRGPRGEGRRCGRATVGYLPRRLARRSGPSCPRRGTARRHGVRTGARPGVPPLPPVPPPSPPPAPRRTTAPIAPRDSPRSAPHARLAPAVRRAPAGGGDSGSGAPRSGPCGGGRALCLRHIVCVRPAGGR